LHSKEDGTKLKGKQITKKEGKKEKHTTMGQGSSIIFLKKNAWVWLVAICQ
jgi:hypothetical protein